MIYISDETIDKLIKEDTPYIDLTTSILEIGDELGRMTFVSREDGVMAGSEEVVRILEKLDISVIQTVKSGTTIKAGEDLIVAQGRASDLHIAWKVCLNILEYCCGMASRTKRLVDKARDVSIVTTRKIFPGTKELSIKSILAGGAYPHRLGLSETILIFEQHLNFYGGIDNVCKNIKDIRKKTCEKKIIVEVENLEDAINLAQAGVDAIQFDKVDVRDLRTYVERLRDINKDITLIGAGGINEKNIEEYASIGLDAIATTAVYFGKPLDMTAKMEKI